jgi:preprotein translocase subunit SecA
LVTVNDYLARRDAGWMAPIYDFLGLTLGVIGPQFAYVFDPQYSSEEETDERLSRLRPVAKKEAYLADITYGTNNEFGFDYLRDNMTQDQNQLSQREMAYAIVDEVDSILIDEARTPLIISAATNESASLYAQFADYVRKLNPATDYAVDEKARTSSLTNEGIRKLERLAGVTNLYDPQNVTLVHHADVAVRARALFQKNRDYVVKNGEVIIVDEFTGRMLEGRRYSGGLHQAIEAKERVAVKEESVTLATITFQNLFRIYAKLAGMTGTAVTEAEEFSKIYSLEVVTIPTNRQNQRIDREDAIYKTEEAKFRAVAEQVRELSKTGQPVLIGTVSVAKSERLSKILKTLGVEHTVLNAKHHQKEGEIVAQAGRLGAVTVATNMAGRGVDIILGGSPPRSTENAQAFKEWEKLHQEVIELGGLFVVGTERHESRRIDNQLRGRAGRQGDPGASQFYLSMEDDLMRIFGGDRMKSLMERLNIPDDMAIHNKLLSRAVEQAQTKVEGHNFEIRKHLVEYDDVMNKHREAIYRNRQRILHAHSPEQATELHNSIVASMTPEQSAEFEEKSKRWTPELRFNIERAVTLRAIDVLWVEHLRSMEEMRESIGLRAHGQRDPLVEYKQEAFRLFGLLQENINAQIREMVIHVQVEATPPPPPAPVATVLSGNDEASGTSASPTQQKVGRNDPCPCGAINPETQKPYKYKNCGLINAPHHRS